MTYTGTDVMRGPGGFGGRPGGMPEGFEPGEMPENFEPGQMPTLPDGETFPAALDPSNREGRGQRPDSMTPPADNGAPALPENMTPPELPEDQTLPDREFSQAGFGGRRQGNGVPGEPSAEFYMNDMVNFFSGVTTAQ